ncbi:MAG: alpha/beta hydrolase [Pseudomonadales bacterium]|nr:alpha/beta hydrolase [Pseudomonadales bacterium]
MKDCPVLASTDAWEYEVESGLTLRGNSHPAKDKPMLHFMHGVAFCGKLYWPLLKQLTENNGLFMQDMQGHGESDAGDLFVGWEKAIEHAFGVMDNFEVKNSGSALIGMGHSYGASLSVIMAVQRPELFDGLILLDPMIMPPELLVKLPINESPMAQRTLRRKAKWDNLEQVHRFFRSKPAFAQWTEDAFTSFIDHTLVLHSDGSYHLKCAPQTEAEVLASPLETIWENLDKLVVPTVIIHGDDARSPILANSKKAAQTNPNITAVQMTGGHNFMQEIPEETYEQVCLALKSFGY